MDQKRRYPVQGEVQRNIQCRVLLSALAFFIFLASGCALWKGKEEKELPCLVTPERIAGIYGTKLSSADSPGRMVRLKLLSNHRAEMLSDYLNDKSAIHEIGQWECRQGPKVKVVITGRMDSAYEKPVNFTFAVDPDGLTATQYDRDTWGDQGLHLTRNPMVTGVVWRLMQIQYANNTAVVPDDPSKYALVLSQDGTVTVRADCNRGMGSFLLAGTSLKMQKFTYTHMICSESSLYDQYTKALETAGSCLIRDGDFYIMLQMENGVMKFEPAKVED
jgi:hypothetical protein